MYLRGDFEDRLEADAFLANVACGAGFSAFANGTYRFDIAFGEAVLVAINFNPVLVQAELE